MNQYEKSITAHSSDTNVNLEVELTNCDSKDNIEEEAQHEEQNKMDEYQFEVVESDDENFETRMKRLEREALDQDNWFSRNPNLEQMLEDENSGKIIYRPRKIEHKEEITLISESDEEFSITEEET